MTARAYDRDRPYPFEPYIGRRFFNLSRKREREVAREEEGLEFISQAALLDPDFDDFGSDRWGRPDLLSGRRIISGAE
jgi:hypothetical protein